MKVRSLLVAALLLATTAQASEQTTTDRVVEQAQNLFEQTISVLSKPFPFISEREIQCLARNIFYESASEPVEGKVAVGLVTLNRAADPRFPSDVCGVVKQKTIFTRTQTVVKETEGILGRKQTTQETKTVTVPVCQFSWTCVQVKKPKEDDPRWIQSQEIAQELAQGGYEHYRIKYADAKYFHAVYVKPGWKLERVTRVGNHVFYK